MRDLSLYLKNRKLNYEKLKKFGFIKNNDSYMLEKNIHNDEFKVVIYFSDAKQESKIIDLFSNEEYILVDTEASGSFVGVIKDEYESLINSVIEGCSDVNIFKNKKSKYIINYVKEKYNNNLEFLWDRYPNCAIWRNSSNNKWYGLIMKIKGSSLGLDSDELIEVLNLKYQKDRTSEVIDGVTIFPAYHMNKKSRITIRLDDNVDIDKLKELVDNSYNLLDKKSQKMDNLSEKVYEYLTKIPKGKVVTYKQIAEYLGNKGLARIVGTILHNNKDGDKYPCYKVLNSKGELADAFVFGGKEVQKQRLEKDGIEVIDYKVDLNKYKW